MADPSPADITLAWLNSGEYPDDRDPEFEDAFVFYVQNMSQLLRDEAYIERLLWRGKNVEQLKRDFAEKYRMRFE
jgi:hypothetical protein